MSTSSSMKTRKKVTTHTFQQKKERGEPISMLTAYDYPTAAVIDSVGIDSILVGDSLGMVVLGYENTLPVTMTDMIHHCKAVARGAQYALLIGDMPFMSYQISTPEAVRNAGMFLKDGRMDAVKLEGGRERLGAIEAILSAGIPVMGHLGLTPQSVHQLGGFRAQGKTLGQAKRLVEDAQALQDAGCFSIVLESVPARLGELVSQRLTVPTIGIGAGVNCDGQVLVTHDLLGLFERHTPRFVKQYAQLAPAMRKAFESFQRDVQEKEFPTEKHTVAMPDDVWEDLLAELAD